MTNPVGLRFLLDSGMFIMVVVPDAEARSIIQGWVSRQYATQGIEYLSDLKSPQAWSVQLNKVQAIHTFSLDELRQQQPGMQTMTPAPGVVQSGPQWMR